MSIILNSGIAERSLGVILVHDLLTLHRSESLCATHRINRVAGDEVSDTDDLC